MASKKKLWQEELEDKKDLPKTLVLEKNFPCYNAVHWITTDSLHSAYIPNGEPHSTLCFFHLEKQPVFIFEIQQGESPG